MIILNDKNSGGRVDILGLTTKDLQLLQMSIETLMETDADYDRIRLHKLYWDFKMSVCDYRSNANKMHLYRPEIKTPYLGIDLGLPSGLLWATCNVGATSPEQTGLYFAWGETFGYSLEMLETAPIAFNDENYRLCKVSDKFTQSMDAAKVYMGDKWRMPTKEDFEELTDYCRSELVENYKESGVKGLLLTSCVNGNSIFLPAAGHCGESQVYDFGTIGNYWSSSLFDMGNSWVLSFKDDITDTQIFKRCEGLPLRAVMKA